MRNPTGSRSLLTHRFVEEQPLPKDKACIIWDTKEAGFGLRVAPRSARYPDGVKTFILNYRNRDTHRERRGKLGRFPAMKPEAARKLARAWKVEIEDGNDPVADRRNSRRVQREAPHIDDLCDKYLREHGPKKRSVKDDESLINQHVKPRLGRRLVADVTYEDIEKLHRDVSKKTPIRANRLISLLSKVFNLSIRWGWRTDNPARGIEKNAEQKRQRYLTFEEMNRLSKALDEYRDQASADVIRFLMLSGARTGEVTAATWSQFDLAEGIWTKPASSTKTARIHRVPLSGPARQLLAGNRKRADDTSGTALVFPSATGKRRTNLAKFWHQIRDAADLTDVRVHDLRHQFASTLVSSGFALPVITALLGHQRAETTNRYAHLFDAALREATERVGAIVVAAGSNDEGAEVIEI